jgi:FlaA1/EpsC-like NDP-sugar epimerase
MRNRYLLLLDLPAIALAVFGSFVLRLDWFFLEYRRIFWICLACAITIKPPVFLVFGLYSRYWRYASVREFIEIVLAVSVASVGLGLAITAGIGFGFLPGFPRSILFGDWLLTLALIGGARLAVRVVSEASDARHKVSGADSKLRSVLVVGAGEAGTLFVREMQRNANLGYRPIGFLDDDPVKRGKRISGVPVLGGLDRLSEIVARLKPDQVIIAMPTAGGAVIREMTEAVRQSGVVFRIMPGVYELLDGDVSVTRLRDVDVSDLLRRAQVPTRPQAARYLTGQVVLISGAGGSIGSELCRQVASAGPMELVMLGHGENSIFETEAELRSLFPSLRLSCVIVDTRDHGRLLSVFERFRPALVFHAAAHKHVPLMELNVEEAVTNNILGTRNMVAACRATGTARFVLISTDKAVAPTNVMGATKRIAEMLVRTEPKDRGLICAAVRFGNVLGSRGSVIPTFKRLIEQGRAITVTHPDVRRYFMTIPEAVHLVIEAGGLARGGELFCLNMGAPVRIRDLAQDLIRLSGYSEQEIPIVYSGLRPGEKLDEQLWETGATVTPTEVGDLLRIDEGEPGIPGLGDIVERLIATARSGDESSIRQLLEQAIPSSRLGSMPATPNG